MARELVENLLLPARAQDRDDGFWTQEIKRRHESSHGVPRSNSIAIIQAKLGPAGFSSSLRPGPVVDRPCRSPRWGGDIRCSDAQCQHEGALMRPKAFSPAGRRSRGLFAPTIGAGARDRIRISSKLAPDARSGMLPSHSMTDLSRRFRFRSEDGFRARSASGFRLLLTAPVSPAAARRTRESEGSRGIWRRCGGRYRCLLP
jgi:hypothetical protein